MAWFTIAEVQSSDFTLPQDGTMGELKGTKTEHNYKLPITRGQWRYTINVSSAKSSGKGILRFKVKVNSHWIVPRQKIAPGGVLTNTFCVDNDLLFLRFIFSRGIGTTGVRYLCQLEGPTDTSDCTTVNDGQDPLPRYWFGGKW